MDAAARGEEALASGDWEGARAAFEGSLSSGAGPEGHDGLGRALWWLGDVDGALEHRESAYAELRRRGDRRAAARIALWLAREYAEGLGNPVASNGWIARVEGLLRDEPSCAEHGWLELARGQLVLDVSDARSHAEAAVEAGRRFGDADLEASGLALLGRALVAGGDVDDGLVKVDEAMVAATAGEVTDPMSFGDICCAATRALEDAADMTRLMKWGEVVMSYLARHQHAPLLSFCGTCCAEVFLGNGKVQDAERELVNALRALEGTGHKARCIHPAAKLAELRVLQGRIEDAERLLDGWPDEPDTQRASVFIHLARGEASLAAALLHRQLNRLHGDNLLAVPLLSLLVEAQLAQGDLKSADGSARRVSAFARRTGVPRVIAAAELATGRVAAATRDPDAPAHLEAAIEVFAKLDMPLDAARARLELARALRDTEPDLAAREARLAIDAFDEVGATSLADEAAAIVRELGGPARTGPKALGLLSKREV